MLGKIKITAELHFRIMQNCVLAVINETANYKLEDYIIAVCKENDCTIAQLAGKLAQEISELKP